MPDLGDNWGPRVSLALGKDRSRWPVLRLGYGIYYGIIANAITETALTQTGSLNGDLSYFIRPADGNTFIDGTSSAPPFPHVLTGPPASVVKPGAVEFATSFRNPEVHQAVAAIEQTLPGGIQLTASMMLSLGRRLPIFIDTNLATNLASPANSQSQSSHRPSPTTYVTRLPPPRPVPATPTVLAATSAWVPSRPRESQFPSTRRLQAQALPAGLIRTTNKSTRWRAKRIRPMRRPWSGSRAMAVAA